MPAPALRDHSRLPTRPARTTRLDELLRCHRDTHQNKTRTLHRKRNTPTTLPRHRGFSFAQNQGGSMKLNSFGATIARVEAERLQQAKDAIAAGWTPDQHPGVCCPPDKTPQPKRGGRSRYEVQRLRDQAAGRAKWWSDTVERTQAKLDNRENIRPQFDHGMLQVNLKTRQREANAGQRIWKELEHAKQRADHFRRLAHKYDQQLERKQ